jgi:acyl-coenzyme A synthetase/AMP-(fatty) acid ligase
VSRVSEVGEPIGAALGRLAREDPDRPAVTLGGLSVTRGELDRRSNRLARAFAAAGVGPEDLVTIALPNSVEFLEAAVACWKLGAVPQPVSARLPGRELTAIVEVADSALVGMVRSGGCDSSGSGLIRRASTGVSESARHDGGACKLDHSWLDRSARVLARLACWHGFRRVAADR